VSESQALHSWGELCLGLAAPRNLGTNCDDDKTLSVEVIRIMLDCGMAHALLIALHRVDLQHPRASSIVASLLCPFEVLSRSSVSTAVKHVAEKEAGSIDTNVSGKTAKADGQSKERNDSFADDHMLEDAFARTSRDQQRANEGIEDDFADAEVIEVDRGHEMNDDFIVAEEAQDMDEVEIAENDMDVDEDVEVEVEGESDEEMSSSEGSDESSTGDDDDSSEEDEEEDDDDDSESMIEEDESLDDQDADSVNDFHVDYNDDSLVENNDFGSDIPPTEGEEQGAGEDWTRLDANGFGGTVLASRRGIGQQLRGMNAPRGFLDAAEAMIGTLLRTGDIQGEALAELEGSLGIRLVRSDRLQGQLNTGQGSPFSNAAAGGRSFIGDRNRDSVGTLPLIQQRNQPDVGYSNLGDGRRWSVSATEYIYGGPSMSAGSRNYELAPRVIDLADEPVPTASQIDAPLFPGGPAAVAHSRAQHSLHPLLCGLDLPPMNSLVSDLLPHSVRETRRGQLRTRAPGDWTASPVSTSLSGGGFLVSTSSGNIIRTNGGPGGMALSLGTHSRGSSGPIGWSDDGLPLDSTVEEFSAAFDRALGVFMVPQAQREDSIELAMHAPPSILGREASTDIDIADAVRPNNRIDGQYEEEPNTEGHPDGTDMLEMFGMIGVAVDARDGGGVGSSPAVGSGVSNHNETADQAGDSATDPGVTEARRPSPQSTGGSRHEPAIAENAVSPQETEMVVGSRYDQGGPGRNSLADALGGVALTCPPDIDPEAFDALTPEIQREVVEQAQATANVASQLDAASSLDPEALAALPEEMRREVIEHEQRLRRLEEQAPADPANAEEMDNASFVASLAPDLREEILLTVDDAFLESLPAHLRTEAHILRGRASTDFRRVHAEPISAQGGSSAASATTQRALNRTDNREPPESGASRRKERPYGKIKVDVDRDSLVPVPQDRSLSQSLLFGKSDFEVFVRLFYLLSPVRPQRLLHNVLQNMAGVKQLRKALTSVFIRLLHDDNQGAIAAIASMEKECDFTPKMHELSGEKMTDFPPAFLIGASPTVADADELNPNLSMIRRKQTSDTAASIAANLPISARGSRHEHQLPPVVASRIMETLQAMCKNSPRFCISILVVGPGSGDVQGTGFDMLLDLLEKTRYAKSSANLEQLLTLLESTVSPLSNLPKHGEDDADLNQRDLDAASSTGKEWVEVPRVAVSQRRLQLLCSILRMETCRESSFVKVNTIVRRLCRVDANRGYILAELASVARALGADAIRDLKALNIRMLNAVESGIGNSSDLKNVNSDSTNDITEVAPKSKGGTSSSVAVSTSTSELKLLRVLQTLQALCIDVVDESGANKDGNVYVTEEFVHLLNAMELDDLWAELSSCLKVVQVLEGVVVEDKDASGDGSNEGEDENGDSAKKLQNSVAGLLTRFLPSIEAFFVANATATRGNEKTDRQEGGDGVDDTYHLVGGPRLFDFVTSNKVLVNAMIRSNSNLLDKGLKALVHVPRCRVLLDFDVKRQWFKSQLRRLRQQANRRNASLRLHINRENVLIDAYHQLCLRNADEMRGRLHITFRDEQGVDAGGLSREFFGILAKEIFNPNYALFTSTEDGSTFQPNPNSSINPDHLSYFRFVGRIVGKAVLDGYLLDAHFTRSLYKHMLGIEPTHHDMEAIDPDYYKNLKTILEYDLGDLGLELTFSIEDHSFGRSRMIDLVPNGRNVPVTEESKANYVRLVCQHRMTTSIKSQINAYLDGFYELVSRDLISIFTPRELELLISGLPDIDVLDLKQNTDYVGWKATDKQIQWFWNVLFSLSRNQKASFLQFVTGSSKVPLAGFGELPGMRGVQKFSIHKAGGSAGALMSAHTCFNSLDLPIYSSEEELKEKLLYAITEGSGGFALA
jgi:E3 ubiquitin-protein ligase HUWE1